MPPTSPRAIFASRAKVVVGRTPMLRITISAAMRFCELSTTSILSSLFSNATTPSPKCSSTPLVTRCSCTICAIVKSIGAITCGAISTTETLAPAACKFSAISRPMNPPPTITARCTRCFVIYSLMRSVSYTFLRVNIPSLSMPLIGGLTAVAPGDRRSRS